MTSRGTLTMVHASLATVEQLFEYKASGFALPPFPGYSDDQWGIKAHNRPWVEAAGRWQAGQRILEVGGAYSRFPEYLGSKYGVDPWIADDFGIGTDEEAMWSRWGDPRELPGRYPTVTYSFTRLGRYSDQLPTGSFDCVFSISTLEHIPPEQMPDVLADMHRLLAPGGVELHTIDVSVGRPKTLAAQWLAEKIPPLRRLDSRLQHGIARWIDLFKRSGAAISTRIPSVSTLLDRRILVESPDVVFRFYPPNEAPKPYAPAASLLIVITRGA
jgi:SAM-dependent methyltransferase